tara:strand:- start:2588 stop:3874 length:1287 start_codon:yes stop_codon:yes gene_type:complete
MSNYKAIVGKVDKVIPIPKADNIQVAMVLGESVIVSKSLEVGHVGLFFCSGTQLSLDFAGYNNLHRHVELNHDKTKAGFFDDNRRVRAQPFMKIKSEGYFTELSALEWTGYDLSKLKVGDSFEELNGKGVCCKYINPRTKVQGAAGKKTKKKSVPTFLEHSDTAQFKYNTHRVEKGDLISIQSKLHGTSHRSGYHEASLSLPKWKLLINKVVKVFHESEFQWLTGTRRVILSGLTKEGFHGSDDFRYDVTNQLKPYLEKGMTVYGEICGYANDKLIMSKHSTKDLKNKAVSKKYGPEIIYKYGCVEGESRFHVYRITVTSASGFVTEFSQKQLVKWCVDRDILPSHDLVEPFFFDGNIEGLKELVDNLTERNDLLTEDYHDSSQVNEGIIIRIDNAEMKPIFLKNKSYLFKVMEGIASEKEVDIEDTV